MTARLYQFAGNKKATADDSEENLEVGQDLPELSLEMLEHLFDRLSSEDKKNLLRHKIIPVASLPHLTLYGAAGKRARHYAGKQNKRVIAQINPQDLRSAVRRKLGAELLAKATHHLRVRRPEFSAFKRVTGLQGSGLAMVLFLTIAAWVTVDPFYFYAGLSFACGLFFLAVIALRLLCLLQAPTSAVTEHPMMSNEDLPDYTVLVPVFRETQVLAQLVRSLLKLSYPALCIKRTKTE